MDVIRQLRREASSDSGGGRHSCAYYSLLRRGRYNSKEHLRDDMIRSRREEEAHLGRFFFLFVAIAT